MKGIMREIIVFAFLLTIVGCKSSPGGNNNKPENLPGGMYKLNSGNVYAVPKNLEEKTRSSIPELGQYVIDFDNINFSEEDEIFFINPDTTVIAGYIPRATLISKEGVSYVASIDLGNLNIFELNEIGLLDFSLGASNKRALEGRRVITLDLGDFDLISGLANINPENESRIFLINEILISDIINTNEIGGSIEFRNFELSTEFNRTYEGFGIIMASSFLEIKSNFTFDADLERSNTDATRLHYVLDIDESKAQELIETPIWSLDTGTETQVAFHRALSTSSENDTLELISESKTPQEYQGASKINLSTGIHTIRYVQYSGNIAYTVEVSITIDGDNNLKINDKKINAISWTSFDPKKEYMFRSSKNIEEIIERIRIRKDELFREQTILYAEGNSRENVNSKLLKNVKAKEMLELINKIRENPAINNQLRDDQILILDSAEILLLHLNNENAEIEKLIEMSELSSNRNELIVSNAYYLRALEKLEKDAFLEAGQDFEKSIELLRDNDEISVAPIEDMAIVSYINFANEAHFNANDSLELLDPYIRALGSDFELKSIKSTGILSLISSLTQAGISLEKITNDYMTGKLIIAIDELEALNEKMKIARMRSQEIVASSNRAPRLNLDWTENQSIHDNPPYPWQKTVFIPGQEVIFNVLGGNAYIKAIDGSIQVSALINVPLGNYPYVSWDWKAVDLPPNGNLMDEETDDQAIQVAFSLYNIIGGTKVINYVWDSNASKGTILQNRSVGFGEFQQNVSYIVLESGTEHQSQWRHVRINLLEDMKKLFPDIRRHDEFWIKTVTVQSNSWRTKSISSGEIGEIRFSENSLSEDITLHK